MNPHSVPTVSDLKAQFSERGIHPSQKRGQNFLVDASLMRLVARLADVSPRDVILEPGCGTGGLTGLLAESAGAIVAVEVDRKLHEMAAENLAARPNVRLIHSDVMGADGVLAPPVCDALRAAMSSVPQARFKLAANLPYAVSTSVIDALLTGPIVPELMVAMVQREVADRLSAAPGLKEYGFLTIIVQAAAQVETMRRVSPKAFWPQPEVESAIVRIRPDAALRAAAGDLSALRRLAGTLFTHRRKQAAASLTRERLVSGRSEALRLLAEIGLSEDVRPEQMRVEQFIRLAARLS